MALMTVTEYAARSGLNKGTVSRLVSSGVILNHGVPGKPLIDPDQADAARSAALDPSKTRAPAAVPSAPAAAEAPPVGPSASGSYTKARGVRETFAAKQAELDYRERVGQLLVREEVEDATVKIATEVQRRLAERAPALADRLVGMTDLARIATLIRDADRLVCEDMVLAFERLAAAAAPPPEAPDGQ